MWAANMFISNSLYGKQQSPLQDPFPLNRRENRDSEEGSMPRSERSCAAIAAAVLLLASPVFAQEAASPHRCEAVLRANVVALDQAFQVNRLGTTRTDGEI